MVSSTQIITASDPCDRHQLPPLSPMRTMQGFVRKRVLPVLFPAEGAHATASPIRDSSSVAADAGNGQGPLLLQAWGAGKGEVAPPPPEAGSKIVDRAAEDGKVGALVKASPGKSGEGKKKEVWPSHGSQKDLVFRFFASTQTASVAWE